MTSPTPNDLRKVIKSARARMLIYSVYVVAILVIGAIQVGFAAAEVAAPSWLTVALAVAAYLGVPVGALAAANTPSDR